MVTYLALRTNWPSASECVQLQLRQHRWIRIQRGGSMTESTQPTRPSAETREAEHEEEMLKRGANQQGEGRLP